MAERLEPTDFFKNLEVTGPIIGGVVAEITRGSADDWMYHLARFDADGQVMWQTDKLDRVGIRPAVNGDRVYWVYSQRSDARDRRRLRCYDLDGNQQWDVQVEREGIIIDSFAVAVGRPAFDAEGNIYISSQSSYTSGNYVTVHAFKPDGSVLWDVEIGVASGSYWLGFAPQVHEMDGKLYAVVGQTLARLNPATGAVMYQTDIGIGVEPVWFGGKFWQSGAVGGKFYLVGESHWAIDDSENIENTMLVAEDTGSAFALVDTVVLYRQPRLFSTSAWVGNGFTDVTERDGILYMVGYFYDVGLAGPFALAYDTTAGAVLWLNNTDTGPRETYDTEYWSVGHGGTYLYCGGYQYNRESAFYEVRDPATGELLAEQPGMTGDSEDVYSNIAVVPDTEPEPVVMDDYFKILERPQPTPGTPAVSALMMIAWAGDPGDDDRVTLWDPDTGERLVTQFDPENIYDYPEGVTGADGKFYLGNRSSLGGHRTMRLDGNGLIEWVSSGSPAFNGYNRSLAVSNGGTRLLVNAGWKLYEGSIEDGVLTGFAGLDSATEWVPWVAWTPDDDGVIVASQFSPYTLRRFDLSGNQVWSVPLGSSNARTFVVVGDYIYVGHGNFNASYVRRFAVADGAEDVAWKMGPYVFVSGLSAGAGEHADRLYFVTDWFVVCVNIATRETVFATTERLDANIPPVRTEAAPDGGVFVALYRAFGYGMRAFRLDATGGTAWGGELVPVDGQVMGLAYTSAPEGLPIPASSGVIDFFTSEEV